MPFIAALACLFALPAALLTAQIRMDNWQTYTSMYNARTADTDSRGVVWVGTTGGVYRYDPATQSTEMYRNIGALQSLNVSALRIQPETDVVYAGCSDGVINIYRNGAWEYETAIRIKAEEFASVQINDFLFDGDRIFIAGDFGITIYYPESRTFGTTIINFNGVRNIPVTNLLSWQGRLWAATNGGVFSAPLGTSQFNLPSIWQPYSFTDFNGSAITRGLAVHGDTLFTGLGNNLWKLENDSFVRSVELDTTVTAILSSPEGLFASDLFSVVRYPDEVLYNRRRTNNIVNGLARLPSSFGTPGILYSMFGLSVVAGRDSLVFLTPNSPQSNLFMDMAVGDDGSLWSATIKDDAGSGFSRMKDGVWTNFTKDRYPELLTDSYVQINTGQNGEMWASSWGFGLAHLVPSADTFDITVYETSNSPITGINPGDDFEVLGETVTDLNGVTWILEHARDTRPGYLIARSADGTFHTFSRPGGHGGSWYFNSIVIDQSGTKWFASSSDVSGNVVLYFNDRGTLDNRTDDVWGALDATSLTGTIIYGMAVDKKGVVWLAGEEGLYSIDNTFAVLSNNKPTPHFAPPLVHQIVNCVMVDALNQKWAGTNSGVWVLNEDATEVLAHFTTDNTPLLSNNITSLATDEKTGTIYIGTRSGLTTAGSLAIRANVDFNDIRCYPQPFVLMEDDELRVEGLAESSVVKVATIDGVLVRTIDSRGSRAAVWDGRNDKGEFVASGVYLISGFSETSGETAVVKAMVIRRE